MAEHPGHFVGQYYDFFSSLLNVFFIFPLRTHNWCSVYLFDLIWFAFLCSSWIFQTYRTSGYRELAGPTTTKETTRVCSTDQWAAMSLAIPVLAQVYFALFQHCRPPHILPELWKFKTDIWVCQAWRARIRNAEIFTILATYLFLGIIQDFKHHILFLNYLTSPHRKDPILPIFREICCADSSFQMHLKNPLRAVEVTPGHSGWYQVSCAFITSQLRGYMSNFPTCSGEHIWNKWHSNTIITPLLSSAIHL